MRLKVFARLQSQGEEETDLSQDAPHKSDIAQQDLGLQSVCDAVLPVASQHQVFSHCVEPLLGRCLQGQSGTVISQGGSGSGGASTLGCSLPLLSDADDQSGMVSRAITTLFQRLGPLAQVFLSAGEVQKEEVLDLLAGTNQQQQRIQQQQQQQQQQQLALQQAGSRVSISSTAAGRPASRALPSQVRMRPMLTRLHVANASHAQAMLQAAVAERQCTPSLEGTASCRAHAVFQLRFQVPVRPASAPPLRGGAPSPSRRQMAGNSRHSSSAHRATSRSGMISFLDLAPHNPRLPVKEAAAVKKSLLSLGRVMVAAQKGDPSTLLRESKLTRLLADCFSDVVVIASVGGGAAAPGADDATLQFLKQLRPGGEAEAKYRMLLRRAAANQAINSHHSRQQRDANSARQLTGNALLFGGACHGQSPALTGASQRRAGSTFSSKASMGVDAGVPRCSSISPAAWRRRSHSPQVTSSTRNAAFTTPVLPAPPRSRNGSSGGSSSSGGAVMGAVSGHHRSPQLNLRAILEDDTTANRDRRTGVGRSTAGGSESTGGASSRGVSTGGGAAGGSAGRWPAPPRQGGSSIPRTSSQQRMASVASGSSYHEGGRGSSSSIDAAAAGACSRGGSHPSAVAGYPTRAPSQSLGPRGMPDVAALRTAKMYPASPLLLQQGQTPNAATGGGFGRARSQSAFPATRPIRPTPDDGIVRGPHHKQLEQQFNTLLGQFQQFMTQGRTGKRTTTVLQLPGQPQLHNQSQALPGQCRTASASVFNARGRSHDGRGGSNECGSGGLAARTSFISLAAVAAAAEERSSAGQGAAHAGGVRRSMEDSSLVPQATRRISNYRQASPTILNPLPLHQLGAVAAKTSTVPADHVKDSSAMGATAHPLTSPLLSQVDDDFSYGGGLPGGLQGDTLLAPGLPYFHYGSLHEQLSNVSARGLNAEALALQARQNAVSGGGSGGGSRSSTPITTASRRSRSTGGVPTSTAIAVAAQSLRRGVEMVEASPASSPAEQTVIAVPGVSCMGHPANGVKAIAAQINASLAAAKAVSLREASPRQKLWPRTAMLSSIGGAAAGPGPSDGGSSVASATVVSSACSMSLLPELMQCDEPAQLPEATDLFNDAAGHAGIFNRNLDNEQSLNNRSPHHDSSTGLPAAGLLGGSTLDCLGGVRHVSQHQLEAELPPLPAHTSCFDDQPDPADMPTPLPDDFLKQMTSTSLGQTSEVQAATAASMAGLVAGVSAHASRRGTQCGSSPFMSPYQSRRATREAAAAAGGGRLAIGSRRTTLDDDLSGAGGGGNVTWVAGGTHALDLAAAVHAAGLTHGADCNTGGGRISRRATREQRPLPELQPLEEQEEATETGPTLYSMKSLPAGGVLQLGEALPLPLPQASLEVDPSWTDEDSIAAVQLLQQGGHTSASQPAEGMGLHAAVASAESGAPFIVNAPSSSPPRTDNTRLAALTSPRVSHRHLDDDADVEMDGCSDTSNGGSDPGHVIGGLATSMAGGPGGQGVLASGCTVTAPGQPYPLADLGFAQFNTSGAALGSAAVSVQQQLNVDTLALSTFSSLPVTGLHGEVPLAASHQAALFGWPSPNRHKQPDVLPSSLAASVTQQHSMSVTASHNSSVASLGACVLMHMDGPGAGQAPASTLTSDATMPGWHKPGWDSLAPTSDMTSAATDAAAGIVGPTAATNAIMSTTITDDVEPAAWPLAGSPTNGVDLEHMPQQAGGGLNRRDEGKRSDGGKWKRWMRLDFGGK